MRTSSFCCAGTTSRLRAGGASRNRVPAQTRFDFLTVYCTYTPSAGHHLTNLHGLLLVLRLPHLSHVSLSAGIRSRKCVLTLARSK